MCNSEIIKLIGTWITDLQDIKSLEEFGRVTLKFKKDGRLDYIIHLEDKYQKILLVYKVENGVIITDQPSKPHEERTPYTITPEGKLLMFYNNKKVTYVRLNVEQCMQPGENA
ncbi:MAG: hypothetical protein V2A64_02510 [Candidatus Omnitrophota bacterium]